MKIENLSNGKITITEDLFQKIQETKEKALDDNLDDDFVYSFKAYGELEEKQDALLCDSEDLVLAKKSFLYTVNVNDMKKIEDQAEMGRTFLANVIFHVKKDTDPENFLSQYQKKYNFYTSKIKVLPTIIVIDPKTRNFEIKIYETPYKYDDFREKQGPLKIRIPGNYDISIEQYEEYIEQKKNKQAAK